MDYELDIVEGRDEELIELIYESQHKKLLKRFKEKETEFSVMRKIGLSGEIVVRHLILHQIAKL
ncbi:MAG: hypothetical protein FJZ04_00330 [Candidatus Moranbacteria bacterium]|nr:hypothetical protein [Candidatus Moranbacteria bacterium]